MGKDESSTSHVWAEGASWQQELFSLPKASSQKINSLASQAIDMMKVSTSKETQGNFLHCLPASMELGSFTGTIIFFVLALLTNLFLVGGIVILIVIVLVIVTVVISPSSPSLLLLSSQLTELQRCCPYS